MTLLFRYPEPLPERYGSSCVSVGMFDGLHVGHQALIQQLDELARSLGCGSRVVVSFYPHPAQVLKKKKDFRPISSLREMLEDLSGLEVDVLYLIRFTSEFSRLSAEEFLSQICLSKLRAKGFVIGPDTAVGKDREGSGEKIEEFFREHGGRTARVPFQERDGSTVGSSSIRKRLLEGDIEGVNLLLGRAYRITGRVCEGDKRGRELGFPTANISLANRLVPKFGVYACLVVFGEEIFRAVCNVGVRPTFSGVGPRLEVHLLDNFQSDLYGSLLEVRFLHILREERTFAGPAELQSQIAQDVQDAYTYFGTLPPLGLGRG